eukprot:487850-Pelagomonas_calceolata.AAC.3
MGSGVRLAVWVPDSGVCAPARGEGELPDTPRCVKSEGVWLPVASEEEGRTPKGSANMTCMEQNHTITDEGSARMMRVTQDSTVTPKGSATVTCTCQTAVQCNDP